MFEEKKELTQEEKIEKAKDLMKEMNELELDENPVACITRVLSTELPTCREKTAELAAVIWVLHSRGLVDAAAIFHVCHACDA